MAKYTETIQDLERVKGYLDRPIPENEQKEALSWWSTGVEIYKQYFSINKKLKRTPVLTLDTRIDSPQTFYKYFSVSEVQQLIIFFLELDAEKEEKKEEIVAPPTKEESTVPAELETLVALKKAHDAELTTDTTHSVADTVKRARETWLRKHEIETAREKRLKTIEDNKERQKQKDADDDAYENFVISAVNPKSGSSREIYQSLALAAEEAIRHQNPNLTDDEVDEAVFRLTDLTISGAIDMNNPLQFYVATKLAIKEAGVDIKDKDLDQIDELERARIEALRTDPYSDHPEEIQNQINLADEAISQKIRDKSLGFVEDIQKEYQDFDVHFPEAVRQNRNIQDAFTRAIPNAKLNIQPTSSLLRDQANILEASIRKEAPDVLTINPTSGGSQYAGFLNITQSSNRTVSPEAARLLGLGLTAEKLNAAQKDPSSPLGKLYHDEKLAPIFKELHFRIRKIHESAAGKEIEKDIRPVGAIDKFFNKLSPTTQSVVKFAMDPRGTLSSWASKEAGKRIGRHLVEHIGTEFAQQAGSFLIKEGLIGGTNAVIKQAAGKVVVKAAGWLAVKMGWHAFAESLNAGAPIIGTLIDIAGTILIEIAQRTIGAAWDKFQNFHREMYGDDFSFKEASVPIVAAGVTLAGMGAAAMGSFIAVRRTTQIAIVSGVGIIVTSTAIVVFYIGFSYLVAPMLSTLVQLDTKEKVEYEDYTVDISSGDCGWPTTGHYTIVTGPLGGTHFKSKLEAIDIAAPDLSPHLSATDGDVFHAGPFSNYGKTIGVRTTNSAGSFEVYYGHLSRMDVGIGAKVKKGQQIGLVGGDGGWSPHIHMEYKGIKYNQCPAGGLQIKEYCCTYNPMPAPPQCQGACNAFSN